MDFCIENKIVLELSKITGAFDVEMLSSAFANGIDWEKVIQVASKNKVLNLLYRNLIKLNLEKNIPHYYKMLFDDSCSCNYIRNEHKLLELEYIQKQAKDNGILMAVVKGGYLIDNIYRDRGIRKTNDIDILIRRSDIKLLHNMMLQNGYQYGEYNSTSNSVIPPSKVQNMLYKTRMYNLLPYVKIDNSVPRKTVIFDFSFALDFSLDTTPVEEMLESAVLKNNALTLQPEHFFIHMCCHHYREASNVAWILLGKDLNLIKFCDVREFVLQNMNESTILKAVEFAKKHHLEKAVYFTIYFLREIYNDGYETDILNLLNIEDEAFLHQYGENDYGEMRTRKKDFWTSLFSIDNKDEINEQPKYKQLI